MAKRSHVVSSFTIIKGGLVEETYTIFQGWDFGASKRENLDRVRAGNPLGATSANWLRDVCKVLNRRFDPGGRDRPLVVLAQAGADRTIWKPLLLWHMTRDEFLLRDFLVHWLFPEFEGGVFRLRPEDVIPYLHRIEKRGLAAEEKGWSDPTRRRVAGGLLKIASEVGLLRGSKVREFAGYHLPEESLLYLLHAVAEENAAAQRILAAEDWKMFLLTPDTMERELLRLHQFHKLGFERAGSLVELKLPFATAGAYAESLVR